MVKRILLTVASVLVLAQAAFQTTISEDVQLTIQRLEATRRRALLDGDVGALNSLLADDFFEVSANGVVRRKADNIADLSSGRLKWLEATVTDENVRVLGSVALYTATMKSRGTVSGQPFGGGGSRISRLYMHRGDRWLCVYAQSTRMAP